MSTAISLRARSTFQSIDAETEVKAGTVINLQASKGPEEAQEPLIRTLSQDAVVEQGEKLTLQVKAEVSDDGELTYAWYVSDSGNVADAELVSRSGKDNTTCEVDTDKAGVWYYFCKIVNTLGEKPHLRQHADDPRGGDKEAGAGQNGKFPCACRLRAGHMRCS